MRTTIFSRHSSVRTGLLAAGLLLTGAIGASAQEATPGVIGEASETTCVTDLGTSEAPEGALSFVVDDATSVARYRVEEEIANAGLSEAVGETNAVIGTVLLGEDGTPLTCSRFDVDLRTLQTDEARRDGRVQEALETESYPVATFIVTGVEGATALADGEEATVTLIGNLELHGVTNQVAWTATVTREGDTISGTAVTSISFDDYGVEKPIMGPVMSIDDTLHLEIEIVATLAS